MLPRDLAGLSGVLGAVCLIFASVVSFVEAKVSTIIRNINNSNNIIESYLSIFPTREISHTQNQCYRNCIIISHNSACKTAYKTFVLFDSLALDNRSRLA